MNSTDLSSMYLHLNLSQDIVQYFGFTYKDEEGVDKYYTFQVMPFGFNDATRKMSELMLPIQHFLHTNGIDYSCFVDDSWGTFLSAFQTHTAQLLIYTLYSCAGWATNYAKSTQFPHTCLYYLGYYIDTVSMRVWAPQLKLVNLQMSIDALVLAHGRDTPVAVKQIASVLGTCCHLLVTHGELLRILSRSSQHSTGTAVTARGWNSSMAIEDQMVKEFKFIHSILHR